MSDGDDDYAFVYFSSVHVTARRGDGFGPWCYVICHQSSTNHSKGLKDRARTDSPVQASSLGWTSANVREH